ncbi:MAG: TonB-dependent receptor [Bacteroidales bacterium]|nr:TonB-dependent receptor [Bacteroidales bacterium]
MPKKISFAAALLFAFLFAPATRAQTYYILDSVSVTASKLPVPLHKNTRTVILMDSLAIASAPAENINDLLKYAVGVDVRQRGAMGMQTDISMRGGTFDQIAILLNGIDISDPQTGHNSADFPVNLSDIDHIEVLEGPAARGHGASSMVGAINIVTKYDGETSASVNLEGGSFKYANANASVSLKGRSSFNMLSAGWQRSDGFNRNAAGGLNNDFGAFKTFYHGNADLDRTTVAWQAGASLKDFGSSTFYSARFDDQFEHSFKTFTAVKAEGKGALHFTPSVYWTHGEDRFELFRGAPDRYPFNYHKTNTVGADFHISADSRLGRSAFGAGARREGIRSTNLGEVLANPDGVYVRGLARTAYTVFAEHSLVLDRLTAFAGVTAACNTGSDEGLHLYPGVEANFRLTDALRIYGSYNASYRMPTFTELYYSVGGHLADPGLKSEKLHAFEGGLKFLGRGIRAVATVYYNKGFDIIDWVQEVSAGEDAPWTSVNHTELNTFGQEATLQLSVGELTGRRNFFLRSVNLGYSHISQDKDVKKGFRSLYSMEYIRHRVTAQADFRLGSRFSANLSYRYVDRATSSDLIKPYSLLDAKLSYSVPALEVYLRANNLLNKEYYDFGDIPQPGLWFMAGIRVTLQKRGE